MNKWISMHIIIEKFKYKKIQLILKRKTFISKENKNCTGGSCFVVCWCFWYQIFDKKY